MNQSADGRRAFHRIGKPDVQWELGAFAAGAEQEQQANCCGDAAGSVVVRLDAGLAEDTADQFCLARRFSPAGQASSGTCCSIRQRVVIVQRSVRTPNQEHRHGERKVAHAVDEKGLLSCGCCFGLLIPEADEQVAANADGFPKYE